MPGFCGYSFLVLAVEGLIGFGLGVLEMKGLPPNFCSLKNTCWNLNIMLLLRMACQVCFLFRFNDAYCTRTCLKSFEIPFISKIITFTSSSCCDLRIQRSFNVSRTWHLFGVGPLESHAMCAMLIMLYPCRQDAPAAPRNEEGVRQAPHDQVHFLA